MKAFGKCFTCKKKNTEVRLYRPYGNFYRPKDNFCNEHLPEDSRDWYVPLWFTDDGEVWGYTSVPEEAIEAFLNLPESTLTALSWERQSRGPGVTHWQPQIIMPS